MTIRIGVDLGGTKIEAIALDDSRILYRKRVPTPQGDYAGTVSAIVGLVQDVEREIGMRGSVGIGTPGVEVPGTGVLKNSNSVALVGKPLRQDIERGLGRQVRMANDANCMALSEAVDGAGAGANVVFGVILGTGVGGGIVAYGKVLHGANGIGGEWGHVPLPLPQPEDLPLPSCYCGRAGCVEQYCCGPALARDYQRLGGSALTAAQISVAAQGGEVLANQALERLEERLARSLAVVIGILDPDVIVLAGGLSNLERLYVNLPERIQRWIFTTDMQTRIVKNVHGDSSGVRGAAWLWD